MEVVHTLWEKKVISVNNLHEVLLCYCYFTLAVLADTTQRVRAQTIRTPVRFP